MFGCIKKLGCLFLIALGAVVYLTRDYWRPFVHRATADRAEADAGGGGDTWEPLSETGAARARRAVAALGQRSGPVYQNLHAADLASLIYQELSRQLPPSAQDVRARVSGERLYVRAVVALSDFGGPAVLGPLGGFLNDRDTVTFGGTLDIVRPGLAQYRIQEVRLGQLGVPGPVIPRLVGQITRGKARPAGVAPDALPLEVPPAIADVRIAKGWVTLYKNTSPQPGAAR